MARTKLRVLQALGSLDPGGVETWLLNVLVNIDWDQFQIDFCTFGPSAGLRASYAEAFGAKVLRCPRDSNLWTFSRQFRRILRQGHYDVVHSHVHLFSGAVLRWAKAEGVRIRVAHSHTSRDDQAGSLARTCYRALMKSWIRRFASHGLAASREAASALFGANWEADHRFQVLHCGIDLSQFEGPINRLEARREFGIPADATVVGHVGRFVPAKNQTFLVEIAAEIAKARPDIHFLFVGDGPLRADVESKSRQARFNGNMHFTGARTDVPRLMRAAMDVFVMPSAWEGLPVALLEAQAAALPCVAADSVTNEAAAEQGSVTFIRRSADAKEWARAVIQSSNAPRVNSEERLSELRQGTFSILNSSRHLMRLYRGNSSLDVASGASTA